MLGVYGRSLKNVFNMLSVDLRKGFIRMQLLIVFTSFLDLFGLAIFIPIITAISNPQSIETSRVLMFLKNATGIADVNRFLLFLFVVAFLVYLFRSVFIYFSIKIQNKFIFKTSEYVGLKTYEYYLNMDFQEFNKKESTQIIRELNVSSTQFSRFLIMPLFLLTSECLVILLIILGIALYDLTVFFMLAGTLFPTAYFFQKLVKKKLNKLGLQENELVPLLYATSNRGIYGYIDAKFRNKESVLANDYLTKLKNLNGVSVSSSTLNIIPSKLFEVVTVAGLLAIFCYAIFFSNNSALIIPLIALYAGAGYRVLPSLGKIVPSLMLLEQYFYLFDVFRTPLKENNQQSEQEEAALEFKKNIVLKAVDFKFKGEQNLFLNEVNLTINSGEIIGFIGKSGSGKTSLVNIISAIYLPDNGEIKIDDEIITRKNARSWQKNISYVQQVPYIEKGTLASNIAFLEENIDKNSLLKAIEMASLSDFVKLIDPEKIEIAENGKNLSGGQKQRIIIARALYNKSKLIILDEATSALDNETENDVNETINKLKGSGVTIIIIAHRYSTLKFTDRIFEIENGAIKKELLYSQIKN